MLYQQHGSVIHALWSGTSGARVTEVYSRVSGTDVRGEPGKLTAEPSQLEAAGQV